MKTRSDNKMDYLKESDYIDWKNPNILQKVQEIKGKLGADLKLDGNNKIEYVKSAFHFVRDRISHSWDVQDSRVTIRASEVLAEKVGICWAKSNLLAALIRAEGIPSGICYQRLTLGDTPDIGYCVHALNAVYIEELSRWIRLDARGNKEGVQAEFSLEHEILAFPVREECGEIDYDIIYDEPVQMTMNILKKSTDVLYMYRHDLPDKI